MTGRLARLQWGLASHLDAKNRTPACRRATGNPSVKRVTQQTFVTLTAALLLAPLAALAGPEASLPPPSLAAFSFSPNQLAASVWYRPGNPKRVVNGHLDESFGRKELWSVLMQNLKRSRGSFGIAAAEIGHLKDSAGLLTLLKAEGIPVSVEVPAFTQPLDGTSSPGPKSAAKPSTARTSFPASSASAIRRTGPTRSAPAGLSRATAARSSLTSWCSTSAYPICCRNSTRRCWRGLPGAGSSENRPRANSALSPPPASRTTVC